MIFLPLLLASAPLLQTEREEIVLLGVSPVQELPSWAQASGQAADQIPRTMRVAWTERRERQGEGRWRVAYGVDCETRRVRRLSEPLNPADSTFAKRRPISGEDGFWYPERPFTLISRLLKQTCPPPN